MFQSFENKSDSGKTAERLAALREQMRKENVNLFMVPHSDEHQNEYLPECAERLSWISGFTGSAGFAIVTLDRAVIFVDGRYTIQVKEQTDANCFDAESLVDNPPSKWLEANLKKGDRIGYDAWVLTLRQCEQFARVAKEKKAEFASVGNLVDRVWQDRPEKPLGQVAVQDLQYAGKSTDKKLIEIQQVIAEKKADLCVLSDPASLAWVFNIRGSDMVHNPLALGYAFIPDKGKPLVFMDGRKLTNEVRDYLSNSAEVFEPDVLTDKLGELAAGKKVLCDSDLVSGALGKVIEGVEGKIIKGRDPVVLPRAIKNEAEIAGTRNAHHRDGVAMVRFLHWLDSQKAETMTEVSVVEKLETIRKENATQMGSNLEEVSFDTISGWGPNGAICHYRVSHDSSLTFQDNSLYLVDSGAQYLDGTTDITRTVAIGQPPHEAVENFTLVLKGHIAISMARFPQGTRGVDIDILARNALWQKGRDYAHGTGHGVGAYMNVHEGPQSISKRGMEPLVPGMIVSNEPGFYVEGAYGIRIENLELVTELEKVPGGNIKVHSFETLTLAPIDLRLVAPEMLTADEMNWLNGYHEWVFHELSPHVEGDVLAWLKQATRVI